MSRQMKVSMILQLIDQLTGPMKGVTGSVQDLQRQLERVQSRRPIRASDWLLQQTEIRRLKREIEAAKNAQDKFNLSGGLGSSVLSGLADGAARAASAYAGLKLAQAAVAAGNQNIHVATAARTAGFNTAERAMIRKAGARLSSAHKMYSGAEVEKMIMDTVTTVGSVKEAVALMPDILRLRTIYDASNPGKNSDREFGLLIKGLELGNLTKDAATFRRALTTVAKTLNAFKDNIQPSWYYEFFRQAGVHSGKLAPDYLQNIVPSLMQDLKGSVGFAQQSFQRNILGGVMSKRAAEQLHELGMLKDSHIVWSNPKDRKGLKYVLPGGIVGTELAMRNPFRWVHELLLPAMNKAKLTQQQRDLLYFGIFQNANTQRMVQALADKKSSIMKDAALVKRAQGLEAASTWANDPNVAWCKARTQFHNFLGSAGETVPSAKIGNWFANMFADYVAPWAQRNPKSAMGAVVGAGAIAGAAGWKGLPLMARGGLALGRNAFDIARAPYLVAKHFHAAAQLQAAANRVPISTFYKTAGKMAGRAALQGALRLAGPAGLGYAVYQTMQGPQVSGDERADIARAWQASARRRMGKQAGPYSIPAPVLSPAAPVPAGWRERASSPAFSVDPAVFEAAKMQAAETGREIQSALNVTAKPRVDNSDLQTTLSLIQQINAGLTGLVSAARAASRSVRVSTGVLHDGYESK